MSGVGLPGWEEKRRETQERRELQERRETQERTLNLGRRRGKRLTVTLREYRPGDEEGMLACIRDEYGETYFKRDFYHPSYLREEAQSGHSTFLVAQTAAGEIAGMLILKEFSPEESMCELASQIFRKKYRGYGLAMPFFVYGMEILLSRSYSAAYCLPVLFHDVTQKLLYRLGMRATGLVLNVFDLSHITHSYQNGRNKKHSQGILIRAVRKWDAGTVWLPKEHREFCAGIYEKLGAAYLIAEDREADREKMPPLCEMSLRQDERQSSLEIRIHRIGLDLPECMTWIHRSIPLKGKQTANVFLNISDRNAVWAYRELTKAGYFFTGLKPLCSDKEYMVLHHSGEVEIYFRDYAVSREFLELVKYISRERGFEEGEAF